MVAMSPSSLGGAAALRRIQGHGHLCYLSNHFNLFRSTEITGSAVPGVSSGQALQIMSYMPNADLVLLNECGHWPPMERPESFPAPQTTWSESRPGPSFAEKWKIPDAPSRSSLRRA